MALPGPRTTVTQLEAIIEVQNGFDPTPFIITANNIVNNILIVGNPASPGVAAYDDGVTPPNYSTMYWIETWLAAHLYTIFDNQLAAAKAGTVNVRYQWKTGLNLQASMYGQQVSLLDYLGLIAAISNTAAIKRSITLKIGWLGKRRRRWEDLDWADITICQ